MNNQNQIQPDSKFDVQEFDVQEFDVRDIHSIVAETGRGPEAVIPVLQAIQERYNYLPEEALHQVCEITDITPAAITGVSTFYSQFRTRPAGRHFIKVCIGTACHVMGANGIYDAFKQYLEIEGDEDTDNQKLFTVEKVACLGCCMLAPAVQIDDITYGFVSAAKIPGVIRDFLAAQDAPRQQAGKDNDKIVSPKGEVRMCLCSSCSASGAGEVFRQFQIQAQELALPVAVKNVGCTGMAYQTPLVDIAMADQRNFLYGRVKKEDVRRILLRHFKPATLKARAGAAVSGLLEKLLTDEAWEPVTRYAVDTRNGPDAAYSGAQQHLVTQHCGRLGPLDIDEYINTGGFEALKKCLTQMNPMDIFRHVEQSGLRGRGGGGFSTAKKWRAVYDAPGELKYIICNGDEGDPGAFMDRMILESFPFRVIEGIIIAARTLGVSRGFLYIRAEYPLAMERIRKALEICKKKNFLGENILDSDFSLELEVVAGAGAFVCGEETALIAAIQGQRGMPRMRAPYPAEKGLWDKPTLVNNVETFSLLPWIIRRGPEPFAELGTDSSRGTKTFALAGKILRSGLIEVPMGITLREIVDTIGGGIPGGKALKAIQVGGPSGGCIPAALADTPVDYEKLTKAGAMMGSGGMVVLDEEDCMVDIARYFMTFTQSESCGKCTHCRVGTRRMLDIIDNLCLGKGRQGDIEKLEQLAEAVSKGSLCGLGRSAPNPVLTTLNYFREEYEAHIHGRCPAKKCKDLITYSITDACIGCTLCAQKCAVNAIPLTPYQKHAVNPELCTKCDTCRQVCPSSAVEVN